MAANSLRGRLRSSGNLRGALWMLASAFIFSLMATIVKLLGSTYSPAVEAFYRQAAGLVALLPVMIRLGPSAYATSRPVLMLLRATCNTVGMILTFFAFQAMPLAEANALSFTRSLWVVPLAAFVVREHVGRWQVGAALVGFAGVLVMLHPGRGAHATFTLPALGMLAAAFLVAISITGMKVLTRDHRPIAMVVWANVLGTMISLPFALTTWKWPAPGDLGLLCLNGVLGVATMSCYVRGMAAGDAAAMASVDYSRLVIAAAVGFFLFGEVPSSWTLVGAALVIAATLTITVREFRRARVVEPASELET